MVNRHAWRFFGEPKWQKLDLTEIPEGQPTAAKAGSQSVVVVRQGSDVFAAPLDLRTRRRAAGRGPAGRRLHRVSVALLALRSRHRPATHGPTTFDQPRYEVRAADGGGWEMRRVGGTSGQNV